MRQLPLFQTTQAKATYVGTCLLLVACGFIPAPVARGETLELPTEPILRLNPETHTAPINSISVDKQGRFMATGSIDRSVCVWDLETGRLEQVLHMPLGPGYVGEVNAVAISPDAKQVAVSGLTGYGEIGDSIYVFDRSSGRLQHRIKQPHMNHLTYSPDGRYLAAMAFAIGLRVYETSRYRMIADDAQSNPEWGDFDTENRLVTTGPDIRLYAAGQYSQPALKRPEPDKERFERAIFSPDGQSIVVSYAWTRIEVLSARTLARQYSPKTKPLAIGHLTGVGWSADGRYLFAQNYSESGASAVIRWSQAGRGDFVTYPLESQAYIDSRPLADGRLVVSARKGSLLAMRDADGKELWVRRSEWPDFKDQDGRNGPGIALSRTGDIVEFGFKQFGKQRARFELKPPRLNLGPSPDASLKGPSLTAPKVTLMPRAYDPFAIAPDHRLFVAGDRHGGVSVYEVGSDRIGGLHIPGYTYAVNITPDGRKVVAGFADGTLRWYELKVRQLNEAEKAERAERMRWRSSVRTPASTNNEKRDRAHSERTEISPTTRAKISSLRKLLQGITEIPARDPPSVAAELFELLALYALPDGRWVLWTPSGYYQASAGAEDLIGWHVNNGVDKAPDFFPVSRFRDRFNRPDVIARVLETGDEQEALRLADQARGEQTVVRDVRALRPPVISILAPVPGEKVTERKLTLTYEAHSATDPITNIEARVGARNARVLQHVPTYRDNRLAVIGQITVEIPAADTVVEVLAHNQNGPSESARYRVNWSGTADFFKPDLYVLAVGVSDYATDENDLKYAAKDARDFVRAIRRQEGEIYKRVYIKLLDERQATREAILDGLDFIDRETTSRDVAVVYLAGHGVNDTQGHYRFLPADYVQGRLNRTTVTEAELKEFLQGVAGKTVLFFDTCYSGNALAIRAGSKPDVDRVANQLADADVGVVVFASTTQGGLARGLDDIQQGAFTKALIEGIEAGKADLTKDLFVSVAELEKYISDRVKELTKGEQKPVTTKPKAVEDWDFIRVPD